MTASRAEPCRFAVLVMLVCAAVSSPVLAEEPLPRVHLVATGGTIANARRGRLTVEELEAALPDATKLARLSHEQFSNVASANLTLNQWLQLAHRINDVFKDDPGLAGIVVTSGTDTLEETAFFLHLTIKDERPVVVVGAMRNPDALGYEGPANLRAAIKVAASPVAKGRGVLVVLNDEINSARDVTKTDANRLQTFRSRDYGLLGVVGSDRVVFFRDLPQRHTIRSEFDVSALTDLPAVEIVLVYQGASGQLIRAAVDGGAKAIVLAGAGAGALAVTQNDGVDYALDHRVVLIRSTRTGSGRVVRGEPAQDVTAAQLRRRNEIIPSEDHAPVKARILAMLALTRTSDRAEIERVFREY
jgi:L-asparaginase